MLGSPRHMVENASLAQSGRAPVETQEGKGSNPLCGSKSFEWPLLHGIHRSRTFEYQGYRRIGVPVCPRCGCHKKPHVAYSNHHTAEPETILNERHGRSQAHCNYCKVRWYTK
jgi:hypothetical protein